MMAVVWHVHVLVIFAIITVYPRKCAADNRRLRQLNAKIDQIQTSFQRRIGNLELEVENLKATLSGSGSVVTQDDLRDCGSHKEIANGRVTGDSFLGGTSTISCDPGYSPTGSAQCKVPVVWETNAKCVSDCPYLELSNGVSQPATSVSHGSSVTITCDSGYLLRGNATATCNDGVYLDVPSCVEARTADCPHLELANGVSHPATSVSHGSNVTITCNSGYSLRGNDTATCNYGVYLNVPSCVEASITDCPELKVPNAVSRPACSVVDGSTVTVTCDTGYSIVSNYMLTCSAGTYNDLPSCFKTGLADMTVISGNVIDVSVPSDEDRSDITGLVFLPDGRLVACDNNNNRIKMLDNTFNVIDSLEVNFGPYDVAIVNISSLVVTLPWRTQLQFVHTDTALQLGTTISVGNKCWGVEVLGDTIYSSCHNTPQRWGGEIRIYNVDGTFVRRIGLTGEQDDGSSNFIAPYYLTVSKKTGNIYVSDLETERITRMSWNGSDIYQYFDPGLRGPRGLFLDPADNMFVCNSYLHRLDVITSTWRKYKSLLTFGDGLYNPYAVAYRASDATLVISSNRNSNQIVVKLSN